MVRLSERLQVLLEGALPGQPLWDICCDHGLLGIRALQEKKVSQVHFVDQVPEIMRRLEARLRELGLDHGELHLADAGTLRVPVEGTVVMAGVGGQCILDILKGLIECGSLQASRLVLSPQKDERDFETSWPLLLGPEWQERDRKNVTESGRVRTILILDRCHG